MEHQTLITVILAAMLLTALYFRGGALVGDNGGSNFLPLLILGIVGFAVFTGRNSDFLNTPDNRNEIPVPPRIEKDTMKENLPVLYDKKEEDVAVETNDLINIAPFEAVQKIIYAIQAGAFSDEMGASIESKKYLQHNPSIIYEKERYKVVIGRFDSWSMAEEYQLENELGGFVRELTITIRR